MTPSTRQIVRKSAYLLTLTFSALGLLFSLGTIYVELYSNGGQPRQLLSAAALGVASMVAGFAALSLRWLRGRSLEMARRIESLERELEPSRVARSAPAGMLSDPIRKECLERLREAWSADLQAGAWIAALQDGERIVELFPDTALARQVAELQPTLTRRIQEDILARRRRRRSSPKRQSPPPVDPSDVDLQLTDEVPETVEPLAGEVVP